jgi:hypothetical protein
MLGGWVICLQVFWAVAGFVPLKMLKFFQEIADSYHYERCINNQADGQLTALSWSPVPKGFVLMPEPMKTPLKKRGG